MFPSHTVTKSAENRGVAETEEEEEEEEEGEEGMIGVTAGVVLLLLVRENLRGEGKEGRGEGEEGEGGAEEAEGEGEGEEVVGETAVLIVGAVAPLIRPF